MSKQVTKKEDKITKWTAVVEHWPSHVDDAKRVEEAVKMWGASFCIRAIDQTALIDARAFGEALLNAKVDPISISQMQEKILTWKPNATPSKRGLTAVEKLMRDAKKSGFSDAQIKAMLAAADGAK